MRSFFKKALATFFIVIFLIPVNAFAQDWDDFLRDDVSRDWGGFYGDVGEDIENGWNCYVNNVETAWVNFTQGIGDPSGDSTAVIREVMQDQTELTAAFDGLSDRINRMVVSDPKRQEIKDVIGGPFYRDRSDPTVEKVINDFLCLEINEIVEQKADGTWIFVDSSEYKLLRQNAKAAVAKINVAFVAPRRPGEVPKGDLLEDFIPQLVRLLFRFASLAVFVSFVVSGLMFVMAFSNEERVTKAKQMLYWSLVGFAFVVLAFAVVKAITDIDFFGFI